MARARHAARRLLWSWCPTDSSAMIRAFARPDGTVTGEPGSPAHRPG
ncbi:hypothetical protein QLX52_33095 [Streptomyces albus]|nr:hypothetical protein [Streptomyces albus]